MGNTYCRANCRVKLCISVTIQNGIECIPITLQHHMSTSPSDDEMSRHWNSKGPITVEICFIYIFHVFAWLHYIYLNSRSATTVETNLGLNSKCCPKRHPFLQMILEHLPRIVVCWLIFQCQVQPNQPNSQSVRIFWQTYQRTRCISICKHTGAPFLLLICHNDLWACHILLVTVQSNYPLKIASFVAFFTTSSSVSYKLFEGLYV